MTEQHTGEEWERRRKGGSRIGRTGPGSGPTLHASYRATDGVTVCGRSTTWPGAVYNGIGFARKLLPGCATTDGRASRRDKLFRTEGQ